MVFAVVATRGNELRELAERRQRLEVPAVFDLLIGERVGPVLVVGVVAFVEAVGGFAVEGFAPCRVVVVLAVPPREEVRVGGDEPKRVAEPSADGDIEDGHGSAGAARRVGGGLAGRRDHAVDEGGGRFGEAEVADGVGVVVHAEVLLQDLREHLCAEVGLAALVAERVLGPRVGDAVAVAVGLVGGTLSPLVEDGQRMVGIQARGGRQV